MQCGSCGKTAPPVGSTAFLGWSEAGLGSVDEGLVPDLADAGELYCPDCKAEDTDGGADEPQDAA